jgi:serine O-acetyltransferase
MPTTMFQQPTRPISQPQHQYQPLDELSSRLRTEALETLEDEPELSHLLNRTVLAPGVNTFEDAVAATIAYKLCSQQQRYQHQHPPTTTATIQNSLSSPYTPDMARQLFLDALHSKDVTTSSEYGHFMLESVRADAEAVVERDPACQTVLEVLLFNKGFAALVCHRVARQRWYQRTPRGRRRTMMALYLQSEASMKFGVDIHPAATIGAGVVFDHGTGIVIGETAHIGDGCTLLQGVTLGGTGKESGDRHPKVGDHVFIGAGANILGNIRIGNAAKIGAGSVVLKPVPDGATAVGSPARLILPKPQSPVMTAHHHPLTTINATNATADVAESTTRPVTPSLIERDSMSIASSLYSSSSTTTLSSLPNRDSWSGGGGVVDDIDLQYPSDIINNNNNHHHNYDHPYSSSCYCSEWNDKDSIIVDGGGMRSQYQRRQPPTVTVR